MDAPHFIPQIIKNCEDIKEEIQQFSLNAKIESKYIWFDVIQTHTFIKLHQKDEYRIIVDNELAQFEKDSFYTKEDFFIKQNYDIRIKPKIKDYGLKIKITPSADKMFLLFDDHFTVIDDEYFYEEIFNFIDTLMAYEGIIFRQQYEQKENLKIQLQKLSKQGLCPQELLLKQAPDLIPSQPAKISFLLKEEWEKNGKTAPENALFGVGKGEIIAECTNPIKGKDGRNLKGVYIHNEFINNNKNISFSYNTLSIQQEETPEKIIFRALDAGYIEISNNIISLHTDFNFDTIKTINTPMLLGGLKSGISLNIKSKDELIDAIDANMIIEASIINIKGSIGENVILKGEKISIEGQTHQSSLIYAQEAKITTHKGKFYGDKFYAKNLDSGFVECDEAIIETAAGASVFAKKLEIKTLKSNNKIYFSQECLFRIIQNGENKITISASAHISTKNTMDFINKKISLLKIKMQAIVKEYQTLLIPARQNKNIIDKIKASDVNTQKAMLADKDIEKIYFDYLRIIKKLKILKKELIKFQNEISDLNNSLLQMEDETLRAKLITQSDWKMENEIIYHRDYPKPSDETLFIEDGESTDIVINPTTKKMIKTR